MARQLTTKEPLVNFQSRFKQRDYDFMLSKGGAEYLRKLVKRERKSEQMKMAIKRKEVVMSEQTEEIDDDRCTVCGDELECGWCVECSRDEEE